MNPHRTQLLARSGLFHDDYDVDVILGDDGDVNQNQVTNFSFEDSLIYNEKRSVSRSFLSYANT